MGGIGSGNRPHGLRRLKIMRIDRAWVNIDKILDGKEDELKPFQKKASLEIGLKTIPQEIKGEGFASNITQVVAGVDPGRVEAVRDRVRQALSEK